MTQRTHFFPRLDVRESPERTPTRSNWLAEWREAIARAATAKAIPSRYSGAQRTPKSCGLDSVLSERRRKGEVFDE